METDADACDAGVTCDVSVTCDAPNKKVEKFNIQASCIHLTYGKAGAKEFAGHLDFNQILQSVAAVKGKRNILGWSMVHERASKSCDMDDEDLDGPGGTSYDHTHAAFWFDGRIHVVKDAVHAFDISDPADKDKPFHPNIKTGGAKLFQRCLVYHRKTWEKPDGFSTGAPKHPDRKVSKEKDAVTYGEQYQLAVDKANEVWPRSGVRKPGTYVGDQYILGEMDLTKRHLWQMEPESKVIEIAIMREAVQLSRDQGIYVAAQSIGATVRTIGEIDALDRIDERQQRASSKVANRLLDSFLTKHGLPVFKTIYERSGVSLKDATTLNTTFVVHGTMAPIPVNQEDVKRINIAVAISSSFKFILNSPAAVVVATHPPTAAAAAAAPRSPPAAAPRPPNSSRPPLSGNFIRPALRTAAVTKRKEPDSPFESACKEDDAVRGNVVRCLSQLLGDDGKARALEMSMWDECHRMGVDYRARVRTITFNLKDPGNAQLVAGVSRGAVDGARLVNMTPEELSSKLAVARQAAAEKSLKHVAKLLPRKVVWTGFFDGPVQASIEICSPDAPMPPIDAPKLVFITDNLLSAEVMVARALGSNGASLAVARGDGVVALGMFLYGSNLVARSETPQAEFCIFPRGAFSSSRKQLGASELLVAIIRTTAPRPPSKDPRFKHAARPRAAWAPWNDNHKEVVLTPSWASLVSF